LSSGVSIGFVAGISGVSGSAEKPFHCFQCACHSLVIHQHANRVPADPSSVPHGFALSKEGAAAPGMAKPGLPWRGRSDDQEVDNQEEVLVGYAPESSRHWVLRRESSPVSSHA